jgi:streptogramin lyase
MSWRLFRSVHHPNRRVPKVRPNLEALEDRRLPSFTFNQFTPTNGGAPHYLTIGPDGNLWFTQDSRVGMLDTGGTFHVSFSPTTTSPGFAGITTGPDANLWIAEKTAKQIARLTPAGTFTEYALSGALTGSPDQITVGPDHNIWFTLPDTGRIGRLMIPSGTGTPLISEFPDPTTHPPQPPLPFPPFAITPGPDGNMWFTEPTGSKLGNITINGSTITQLPSGTTLSGQPYAITAGPDGNIWFTESTASKVASIATDGTHLMEFSTGITAGSVPRAITRGPDGALWFLEEHAGNIAQITTGGVVTEVALPDPSAIGDHSGMVTAPDGNIWFTEEAAGKIGELVFPVDHFQASAAAAASTGLPFQFTLTAANIGNAPVINYAGTVHLTCPGDPAATLPPDYTFTALDSGVHTFTVILRTPGTQSLTAADTTIPTLRGTVSGINISALDDVFIRYQDGQLFEHTASGFQRIDVNTTAVSAGFDSRGAPAAFIIYNTGAVYEWSPNLGFKFIDINAVALSASQVQPDTVFIRYDNNVLFEHTDSGFLPIDVNVVAVSAGVTTGGLASAFILYDTGALYEWGAGGNQAFSLIDINVVSVSASQAAADTAFMIYNNSAAYEHTALSPIAGFRFLENGAMSVSAGVTTGGIAAFIRFNSGALYEWGRGGTPSFTLIDGNVVDASASPAVPDGVYILYDVRFLFEYTPGVFHYLDSNVRAPSAGI